MTYKATDQQNNLQQLASIGNGFIDNNFGYAIDTSPMLQDENISTVYKINWGGQDAYQTYLKRNKAFDYDNFMRVDISKGETQGDYQSDLTIYNIRQKSAPEVSNTQFKPTNPAVVNPPEKTANFNSSNNFYIRETQSSEPWCAAYVNAAAINTFRKATDAPITTAKKIMQADRPDLSDEELSKIQGSTIENFVNIINSKYNIGVTVEERALSFDEVKKEIDAGQIIEMDAYNINAQTYEEKQETGHAVAIVGYVTPKDGDENKTPYYEIWNPWWSSTFYIPVNSKTFRLGGIDYKWERTWHNWRQNGPVSVDVASAKQTVASMGNPTAVKQNLIPENPLLSGRTAFSNTTLINSYSQDVMKQKVSEYGKEKSTTGRDGTYAYSKGTDGKWLKIRKNNKTKQTNEPLLSAPDGFKECVDELEKINEEFFWTGMGTSFIMLAVAIVAACSGPAMLAGILATVIGQLTGGMNSYFDLIGFAGNIWYWVSFSNKADRYFNQTISIKV